MQIRVTIAKKIPWVGRAWRFESELRDGCQKHGMYPEETTHEAEILWRLQCERQAGKATVMTLLKTVGVLIMTPCILDILHFALLKIFVFSLLDFHLLSSPLSAILVTPFYFILEMGFLFCYFLSWKYTPFCLLWFRGSWVRIWLVSQKRLSLISLMSFVNG